MATRVAAAGGGSWTAGATWVGGVAPTASDDVQLNATSGNVTISAAAVCRSLDCTGYTGTLTHTAGALTIGTTSAPPGNLALKFVPGMTYTGPALPPAINFSGSVAAVLDIDWGGKVTGNSTFGAGAATTWRFISPHTQASGGVVTFLAVGHLNVNGQTCVWGSFNGNATVARTLTLGAANITTTATGNSWNLSTAATNANFAVSAALATINCPGNFLGGGKTYGTLNLTGVSASINGNNTFTDLTWTPANAVSFTPVDTLTVTGLLTLKGNNRINQGLVQSAGLGSQQTITAAAIDVAFLDFMDINGAGAANWDLSARNDIGDCGGNAGITFPAPQTIYRINRSSVQDLWSEPLDWSLTNNGPNDARIPLPQDTAIMAQAASNVNVLMDIARVGTVDWRGATGGTGNPQAIGSAAPLSVFGSWLEDGTATANAVIALVLAGRGNYEYSPVRARTQQLDIRAPNGTYTLTANLSISISSNSAMTLAAGTFNSNGYQVQLSGGAARMNVSGGVLNMGTSLWRMGYTGTTTFWNITGGVINGPDSIIDLYQTSVNARTFLGGGGTYGTVRSALGSGQLTIGGDNTIGSIEMGGSAGRNLGIGSGSTQTFTGAGIVNLSAPLVMNLTSASTHFLVKTSGTVVLDYWNITNSNASGGASWFATNSTDGGGNSGWIFAVPSLIITVQQALDGESAQPITPGRSPPVGQALETDTAQSVVPERSRPIGIATEIDSAFLIKRIKRVPLDQATETDTAHSVTPNLVINVPTANRYALVVVDEAPAVVVIGSAPGLVVQVEDVAARVQVADLPDLVTITEVSGNNVVVDEPRGLVGIGPDERFQAVVDEGKLLAIVNEKPTEG